MKTKRLKGSWILLMLAGILIILTPAAAQCDDPVCTKGTTPFPQRSFAASLEPISRDNLNRMQLLAQFGEGGLEEELAVSADGKWLAAAASGGVVVYDAKTGAQMDFYPTTGSVRTLDFSPDSQSLAYISMEISNEHFNGIVEPTMKDLLIYKPQLTARSLPDGKILYEVPLYGRGCGEYQAWDLRYTADGEKLVFRDTFGLVGYESANSLCVLDSQNGDLVKTIAVGLKLGAYGLSTGDPNIAWVSAARETGKAETYKAEISILKYNLESGQADVRTSFPSDGGFGSWWVQTMDEKYLITGSSLVCIISAETGAVSAEISLNEDGRFLSAALAPDGKTLALGTDKGIVSFYSVPGGEKLQEWAPSFPANEKWPNQLPSLKYSPDSSTVYALLNSYFVDTPEFVTAFKVEGWQALFSVSGRNTTDRFPALSPDGTQLAFGGYENGDVQLWSVKNQQRLHILNGHAQAVTTEAFSPDGQQLATGSTDGSIRLWNVADGSAELTLGGHVGQVWALAYARNGSRLISAGADGVLRLWNPQDGSLLNTLISGTGKRQVNQLFPDADNETVWVASGCQYPLSCPERGAGDLRRINLNTGVIVSTVMGESYSFSLTEDGSFYAKDGMPNGVESGTVNADGSLTTGMTYRSPYGNGALTGAAISADGSVVFSGNGVGLQAFDPASGTLIQAIGDDNRGGIYGDLAMALDGKVLVVSDSKGVISLWGIKGE